jgi:hypothetical protein
VYARTVPAAEAGVHAWPVPLHALGAGVYVVRVRQEATGQAEARPLTVAR